MPKVSGQVFCVETGLEQDDIRPWLNAMRQYAVPPVGVEIPVGHVPLLWIVDYDQREIVSWDGSSPSSTPHPVTKFDGQAFLKLVRLISRMGHIQDSGRGGSDIIFKMSEDEAEGLRSFATARRSVDHEPAAIVREKWADIEVLSHAFMYTSAGTYTQINVPVYVCKFTVYEKPTFLQGLTGC